MKTEGLPTRAARRVLEVSESGFYAWRTRPPSARAIRHVWLTDLIHQVHQQSRGTYGPLRVHAELKLGYGIEVGHNAVAMLMRRAGLQGLSGNRGRRWRIRPVDTPADLVDREFVRHEPDEALGDRCDRTSNPRGQGLWNRSGLGCRSYIGRVAPLDLGDIGLRELLGVPSGRRREGSRLVERPLPHCWSYTGWCGLSLRRRDGLERGVMTMRVSTIGLGVLLRDTILCAFAVHPGDSDD